MKRLLLILPLALACESQTFFKRLASDYTPYQNIGNRWEFVVAGEDTFTIEWLVTNRVTLGGVMASEIEEGENILYMAREPDGLYEWVSTKRKFSDEEITLEERWRKRLELPLATGNRWVDSYENEVTHTGLTYRMESKLEGEVDGIDPVLTQADFFENAYAVDIRIETTIDDPISGETTEVTVLREWYAPDVGLVRRKITGSDEWILRDFSVIK